MQSGRIIDPGVNGMDALAILETQVRDLVRDNGVDPARDSATVAKLIRGAVLAYDQRSLAGTLPILRNPDQVVQTLLDSISGLGPIQQYMDDPSVEEIWINNPEQVFVARAGRSELTTTVLTTEQVYELVERMLKTTGRRLDLSSPFVDAMLPGGERLHVVRPDITRRDLAVNIRKFIHRSRGLQDLVASGSCSQQAALFLDAATQAGLSVLVSGQTQAGKTTFLNALAGSIPSTNRVITVEEVFELNLPLRDVVAMQCRPPNLEGHGEISLRRLIKEALRMRPDRIIVGEVREAEAFDLLIALNSGLPAMATLHANSGRDALRKMTALPLLAGENISSDFVIPTVASAIDLVIHLELPHDGKRHISEILAVSGRVENGVIEATPLFSHDGRQLLRASGYPPRREKFDRIGTDLDALLRSDQ